MGRSAAPDFCPSFAHGGFAAGGLARPLSDARSLHVVCVAPEGRERLLEIALNSNDLTSQLCALCRDASEFSDCLLSFVKGSEFMMKKVEALPEAPGDVSVEGVEAAFSARSRSRPTTCLCEGHAREIVSPAAEHHASKLDLFRISEPLVEFPNDPVVAVFPSTIYQAREVVLEGEILLPELVELVPNVGASDASKVVLRAEVDGVESAEITCTVDGGVTTTGASILVRALDEPTVPLADYLTADPPTIFFASGAHVTGNRVAAPPPSVVRVEDGIRRPRSWIGTDITKEFGEAAEGFTSVGDATAAVLRAEMPLVVQDHLAGEIADFIAIDHTTLMPEVRLVHCKRSASAMPAARINDLEELVAQAIRSVQWLVPGPQLWVELRRRLAERPATKVVAGTQEEVEEILDAWSASPPAAAWSIWLVQPGLSAAKLDELAPFCLTLGFMRRWPRR